MTAAVDLRRLVAHLADDAPLDPETASGLVAGLQCYLTEAPAGMTLDRALGLDAGSYGVPWWQPETTERRRELLLRLAEHFRQPDQTNTARAIATAAERYEAGEWSRRDRRLGGCPPEYDGDHRAILYELQRGPYRWPLAWRRIRDLITE